MQGGLVGGLKRKLLAGESLPARSAVSSGEIADERSTPKCQLST